MKKKPNYKFNTELVRNIQNPQEQQSQSKQSQLTNERDAQTGMHHSGIHIPLDYSLTFHYEKSEDLVGAFQGSKKGFTYSRAGSPTVNALEEKITLMENGLGTVSFASGMSALATTFLSLIKKGDHVVASWYLFGNTYSFFKSLIRLGLEVSFVDITDGDAVEKSLRPNTKFFFLETIANPNTQIPDWDRIISLLKEKKIISIVDNTLTSPYLFRPQEHGFSFSLNSLSKSIAGHGAVLGGSITDLGNYNWGEEENVLDLYKKANVKEAGLKQIRKKGLRDMGGTLSPQGAFLIALGSETLPLRMEKQMSNAKQVALFLENHEQVEYVNYPGLESHKGKFLAEKYYRGCGLLLSFKIKTDPLEFCNRFKLILRSSHLGDNRTLSIPVAQTIFNEATKSEKEQLGVEENLIRLSLGIEDGQDLINDLKSSLL